MAFSSHVRTQTSLKKTIFLKQNNLPEAKVLNVKEENNVSSRLRGKVAGNTAQTTPVCPPEAFRLFQTL